MQWFEDETFWELFHPKIFNERRLAAAPAEVDQLLALSGVQRGAVLDLCCGPARHSAILAQKGFVVTAVDRSAFVLNKARERAAAGPPIEFVQADMRDFSRAAAFDLSFSLYTSFGYFENPGEDLQVLRNARAGLKKDGVFVIDVLGKEVLASRHHPTNWTRVNDDIFIEHAEILPGWSRVHNEWLVIQGERVRRFEFGLNLYSGQELADMLHQAGFGEVELFGSLEGTPYDPSATRLVARARARE